QTRAMTARTSASVRYIGASPLEKTAHATNLPGRVALPVTGPATLAAEHLSSRLGIADYSGRLPVNPAAPASSRACPSGQAKSPPPAPSRIGERPRRGPPAGGRSIGGPAASRGYGPPSAALDHAAKDVLPSERGQRRRTCLVGGPPVGFGAVL